MTKFLNISTDNTLGGSSASDTAVSSQKAVKTYIDTEAMPSSTKYGADLSLTSGNLQLLDQDGNALGNSVTVPDASNFANKDLSNLTSTGKNIGNWSSNVTNCITYIPQDIKLELNNGTLTLKTGSKIYIPNGFEQDGVTQKFDTIIIQNDITSSLTGYTSTDIVFCYIQSEQGIRPRIVGNCRSGSGATATAGYAYNTTTNEISYYSAQGAVQFEKCSFPICIVSTNSSGVYISINQVFNGFGYIGSTVFVLPGVEGLIPNGRNLDGTLNSILAHTESVLTYTNTNSSFKWFSFTSPTNNVWTQINFKSDDALALGTRSEYWYFDEQANFWSFNGDKSYNWLDFAHAFVSDTSPYSITNITTKKVFKILDWNDGASISGFGMPSSNYTNLTVGASGSAYTAPANGYFAVSKSMGTNSAIGLTAHDDSNNELYGIRYLNSTNDGRDMKLILPAKKGTTIKLGYAAGGNFQYFRFIYTKGSESEE